MYSSDLYIAQYKVHYSLEFYMTFFGSFLEHYLKTEWIGIVDEKITDC